jgi:hypothetical protein
MAQQNRDMDTRTRSETDACPTAESTSSGRDEKLIGAERLPRKGNDEELELSEAREVRQPV